MANRTLQALGVRKGLSMTQQQLANVLGCRPERVTHWVKSGMPQPAEDSAQSVRWIIDQVLGQSGLAGQGGEQLTLEAERARLAKEQADGHELKNAELRGDLLRVDDVKMSMTRVLAALRSKLLALPSKIAPVLRSTAPDAFEEQLRSGIDDALTELATLEMKDD